MIWAFLALICYDINTLSGMFKAAACVFPDVHLQVVREEKCRSGRWFPRNQGRSLQGLLTWVRERGRTLGPGDRMLITETRDHS